MKLLRITTLLGAVCGCLGLLAAVDTARGDATDPKPEQVDMAALMQQARKYTTPGEQHKLLERFIGEWDTLARIVMPGTSGEGEKGTATFDWLMEGRWIKMQSSGSMMGMQTESFSIMGYDNFKMSYVIVTVGTMDTAMLTSEGDLDPGGEALITYGTLDEYLTGEHDKMVKYVWRFVSDDEMTLEVHDLPIGETNTKVVEITFSRRHPAG